MEQRELDRALDELEARLDELHVLYQRFFTVGETEEPLMLRLDVDRALAALMSRTSGHSASREKLQSVLRTYDQYQQSWERLARRTMNGQQRSRSTPPASVAASSTLDTTLASAQPVSSRPRRPSLTPPLGTPSVPPVQEQPARSRQQPTPERLAAAKPSSDTAKTSKDLRPPFASSTAKRAGLRSASSSDTAKTTTDLRSPVERHALAAPEARRPLPLKLATTLQGIRIPQENELTPVYSARELTLASATSLEPQPMSAPATVRDTPSQPTSDKPRSDPPVSQTLLSSSGERKRGRARVTMEQVRAVHSRLCELAPGARPVSLERLAEALRDTEAKLWAQHGDRKITFEVVLKDGKPVVKPIVH